MKTILHRANTRGHANRGWLDTWHTFSFANYHDPERMHFGMLRVLNDDLIAGGGGFDLHPHDNMEIATIVLEDGLGITETSIFSLKALEDSEILLIEVPLR